jgi:hypothetical protein
MAGLVALSAGCGAAGQILGFDFPRNLDEQRVTGNLVANMAGAALPAGILPPIPVTADVAGEAAARRVPITRVLLKSFRFDITPTAEEGGDTDDFSFIRGATMFFECNSDPCSLPRVQVATAAAPGASRSMIFTPTPNLNLKPYIDAGFRVVLELEAIPPPDDTTFNGQIVLRVEPF